MSSPRTKAQREQTMQLFNRLTHAKKAYTNAQRKANALKREYHKAAFLIIYGRNQPHRANLMAHERAAIRNAMNYVRRALMTNRVLGRSLPHNLVESIARNI